MPTEAPGSAGKRPLRLLRSDRLRKRFEFRRARDEGRRVHTASFVFQVARSEAPGCRLGLTVSRKVGSAVRRNRIKRLLRETFRLERGLFPERADVVVIAKDTCQVRSLADVQAELAAARVALAKAAQKAASSTPRGGAR